ncbi:PRC-barrel domain-containing protein [Frigidibacter sp. MR17.24]|uniref:PRC-barrel domain-containing protein n=1 Tax=Frigidibacter sp. MR17.24 TaxID=3127345 RepID=UPI003012FC49
MALSLACGPAVVVAGAARAETPVIAAAPPPPAASVAGIRDGMPVISTDGVALGKVQRVIPDIAGRHTVIVELALSLGITGDTVSVEAAEAQPEDGRLVVGMTRSQFVDMAQYQG